MMQFVPFAQRNLSLLIWMSSRRKVHTLLPEKDSVEVKKGKEELKYTQFLKPPMMIMQFKVILCTSQ